MRFLLLWSLFSLGLTANLEAANPIITDVFTADPAALVHDGTVYLYTGHDEAPPETIGYQMRDWLVFSSTDMVNWQPEGSPLSLDDFAWANAHAWASHTIERDGRFYWYISAWEEARGEFGIGVAVSDRPTGPFRDALGKPLVTSDLTPNPVNLEGRLVKWDDIDPAAYIDDDGQAYLFWGNTNLYWAKLKDNMVELDGEIHQIELPEFVEAPWVHKKGDFYYLTYSKGFPERTAYATSESIEGPWQYRGVIKQLAGNCNTNHQAILAYKGRDYFIYHNGGTLTGGSFRRSVCIDYLRYNADGTIRPIQPTTEGVYAADEPLPVGLRPGDPTYVIVHGAWAGGWEWQKVATILEERGATVYRPTHTGQGKRRHLSGPEITLQTHIDDVVNEILWEGLEDVVLVGHSYGGMVITGVADRIPERIRKRVYVDAALPMDGESIYDTFGGDGGRMPEEDGFVFPGSFEEGQSIPFIVPQSSATFTQPIALRNSEATANIPSVYLLTAEDAEAPEADGFYRSYRRAQERGWETSVLEGGHVPQVEQPVELADALEAAAR